MTSRQMSVAEAPAAEQAEEIIEITDDMILELTPDEKRGKVLYFPPPLPRAQSLPSTRSRRRKRGSFPVVRDKN
jgi:hypothetical protein